MKTLKLTQNIGNRLRAGYPWIYADALKGDANTGDFVVIKDNDGVVGTGLFEANHPIAVRMWSSRAREIDDTLLDARIKAAKRRRRNLLQTCSGVRVLNGEGDHTPGVTADVYGNVGVLRIDGRAAERWIPQAQASIAKYYNAKSFVVRRSEKYRDKHAKAEWLTDPCEIPVQFHEHGIQFVCDPIDGQKTGFFLDQRENRRRVADLARGKRLLNLFGYTGGFSLSAAMQGATTTTVDLAKPAIETAKQNFELNGFNPKLHDFVASDCEKYLNTLDVHAAPFEVIVCDPPSYAHRRRDLARAETAYIRLFSKVLSVAPIGSTVVLASCSSHVDRKTFQNIIASAAMESNVAYVATAVHSADADHCVLPAFPEGDYLQCAFGTVDDRD